MRRTARRERSAAGDPAGLDINLRHLRALDAVAAAGSIARAADDMHRVPSAVTRSIAELEKAIGRSLVERRPRGVVATAQGELVLARARRIAGELETARTQLAARGFAATRRGAQSPFAALLNGRRLAVIAGLAEQRNMPAVARAFALTQPAVSAAVRDLERTLGAALFERTPRGVVPTPAGEIVAFFFTRALAELRHIGADIAAAEGTLRGTVRVGALPLARTHILPRAIAALLARHPGLHVATVESPYEALAAGLRSGDIDFSLGALRPAVSDLQQQALFIDRLAVVARPGHPLAARRSIGFDALRKATWVLSRPGAPARELFERFFSAARQTPPVPAVETGDLAVLRGLLLESDMLTAISAHQLRYEIRDGTLVELAFPLAGTQRRIGLTQRVGALPPPGARALMDELRRVIRESSDFSGHVDLAAGSN